MRVNKKELKRIIQEEYQKVLEEYISEQEGGLVHVHHTTDAELDQVADIVRDVVGKGGGLHDLKKPLEAEAFDVQATSQFVLVKTPPNGTIAIASANNVELSGDEKLIDTKYGQLAVGRINQGVEEKFDHAAKMDEAEEGRYSQVPGEKSDDPRVAEMRAAVSQLGELQFDSLEDDAQSYVDDAVRNLSKAIDEILYQREVGNI